MAMGTYTICSSKKAKHSLYYGWKQNTSPTIVQSAIKNLRHTVSATRTWFLRSITMALLGPLQAPFPNSIYNFTVLPLQYPSSYDTSLQVFWL